MELLINMTPDLEGLDKQFEVESAQFYFKSNTVIVTGSVVYSQGARKLREAGPASTLTFKTPSNLSGAIEGEDISVTALGRVAGQVEEYIAARMVKDAPVETEGPEDPEENV